MIGPARLHPARSVTGAGVWRRRLAQQTTSVGLARRRAPSRRACIGRAGRAHPPLWPARPPLPVPELGLRRAVRPYLRPVARRRPRGRGPVSRLSLANWHPHLHLVVTDGGFRPDGTFVHLPGWQAYDSAALSEAFRRAVLRLFVRRGFFDEDQVEGMLQWPHSGFHVHAGVGVSEPERGLVPAGRLGSRSSDAPPPNPRRD